MGGLAQGALHFPKSGTRCQQAKVQVNVLGGWQDSRRLRVSPSLPPQGQEERCGQTDTFFMRPAGPDPVVCYQVIYLA